MSFQEESHYLAQQLRNFMARYNIFHNEDLVRAVDTLEDLKEIDNKLDEDKYFLKVPDIDWYFDKYGDIREFKFKTPEEIQKEILDYAWLFDSEEEANKAIKEIRLKHITGDIDLELKKVSDLEVKP